MFFSDIREQGASWRYVISGVCWFIGDVAVGWSRHTSDSNNWLTVTGQSLLINIWILFVRTTQSLRSRLWEERRWPQGKVCSYYPNNELNTRMKTSEGSLKFDQGFRSSLNRCGWFYKGDKSSNKCITDVISCPDAVLSVHPAWMWLFLVGDCWIILFEYSHALPPSWKVLERPNVRGWQDSVRRAWCVGVGVSTRGNNKFPFPALPLPLPLQLLLWPHPYFLNKL